MKFSTEKAFTGLFITGSILLIAFLIINFTIGLSALKKVEKLTIGLFFISLILSFVFCGLEEENKEYLNKLNGQEKEVKDDNISITEENNLDNRMVSGLDIQ